MRTILCGVLVLLLPLWGLGSVTGNLGFRADWQGNTDVNCAALLNLNWSQDALSLGASLSLPFPGLAWSLALRGTLDLEPLRLSLQGGLGPAGLSYLRENISLNAGTWELPQGELRAGAQLDLYMRDPLGTPSLTATGSGSVRLSWEDLWGEATLSLNLYPPPFSLGKAGLALGYRPYPLWITVRNYFLGGWDYSTAEVGYQEAPVRVSVQTTVGPGGFQRANLFFSFNPDPLRLSVSVGATAQGLSPASVSLGLVGEWAEIYLRASVAFPFELRSAGIELRIPF